MRLGLLAHDEGVEPPALRRSRVQHRGRDRVGRHREPTDRVVLQIVGQLEHDPADQRRSEAGQGDTAQIEVVVRLPTGGQGDPAVHHGEVADQGQQLLVVGHPPESRARSISTGSPGSRPGRPFGTPSR